MKKAFLFGVSLICLLPFNAHATIGDDIYYTFQGIKIYAGSGYKWTKYGTGRVMEGAVKAVDGTNRLLTSSPSIDKRLLPYVSGKDLEIIQAKGVDLVVVNSGFAEQQSALNNIVVNLSEVSKESPIFGQILVHHEVQHILDVEILKNAGYSATDMGHVGTLTLDNASQGVLQAILEARAYGEEMVFAYENMKLYKNDPNVKAVYDRLVKEEVCGQAFDKAIREGKSVEEARKAASLAVINSDFFKKGYLDKWANVESDNLTSLSLDEIFALLNDGKFTKEDLLSADGFWNNLCSYDTTKESDMCLAYFARKRTHCVEQLEKKWKSCDNLGSTLAGDSLGGRLFTTDEDEKLYNMCCKKRKEKK